MLLICAQAARKLDTVRSGRYANEILLAAAAYLMCMFEATLSSHLSGYLSNQLHTSASEIATLATGQYAGLSEEQSPMHLLVILISLMKACELSRARMQSRRRCCRG